MERLPRSLMMVVLLVCAGCSLGRRDPDDLTAVISFDDDRVVFYWEGVRIHSPARITMVDEVMIINGVKWKESPAATFDTAAVNEHLAKRFHGVPFVDSLVSAGSSSLEAVNAYGFEMPRRFRRAFLQLRSELRARGESLSFRSAPALAALLDVPINSIRIDGRVATCAFPGGLQWSELMDAPDSVLARDPFYKPPYKLNEREHLRWMTSRIRARLRSREPLLLVWQRSGGSSASVRGPSAPEAQATLERAMRDSLGDVDIQELSRATRIPADLLTTILERRSESPGPY